MISIRPVQAQEWRLYQALRLGALRDCPDAFGSTYAVESTHPEHFWQERIQAACASETDRVLFAEKEGQALRPGLVQVVCLRARSGRYLSDVGGAVGARFASGFCSAGYRSAMGKKQASSLCSLRRDPDE